MQNQAKKRKNRHKSGLAVPPDPFYAASPAVDDIFDNDLARENLQNNLPWADRQD